jgi:hypothetical protein
LSEIRNCSRADITAVADLFQKTFRDSGKAAPRSLEAYLSEAYLGHPGYDPEVASRVHVGAEGRVTGFIGVFPGRFEYRGRAVRAAVAGTLMVEHPEKEPLAGAKLLRSVVKGPQDISISETTNLVSKRLWEPLGGRIVPLLSLEWFRVMRPAAGALSMLTEKFPRGRFLSPAARAVDWMGGPWTRRALRPAGPAGRLTLDAEPSDKAFAEAVMDLAKAIELRPSWRQQDVEWLLAQAARKARYGSLRRTIVRGRKGELLGCHIYHGSAGGMGRVLQLLARQNSVGDVVDCLFHEADQAGLAGLRGRSTPQIMEALLPRKCFFLHRASTMIHAADPELAGVVEAGGALMTGLAGESWTRLVGDEFT